MNTKRTPIPSETSVQTFASGFVGTYWVTKNRYAKNERIAIWIASQDFSNFA